MKLIEEESKTNIKLVTLLIHSVLVLPKISIFKLIILIIS